MFEVPRLLWAGSRAQAVSPRQALWTAPFPVPLLSLDTACWSPSTSATLDPSSTPAHTVMPLDDQGLSPFWFSLAPRVGRKAQHQACPGWLQRLPQPPPGIPLMSLMLAVAWLPRVLGGTRGRIPWAELPMGSQCRVAAGPSALSSFLLQPLPARTRHTAVPAAGASAGVPGPPLPHF